MDSAAYEPPRRSCLTPGCPNDVAPGELDCGVHRTLPLSARLRLEAAQWEDGEDIPTLLIEAAEVIEGIGDAVAQAAVIGAKYALR